MPPETDTFRVIVCPEEYVPEAGLIVGVPSAELTVTRFVDEIAETAEVAESVTL